MMLGRRALTATRHYSTALPSYNSKVRAIPFAFSPEDAINHIGFFASMAGYVSASRERPPNVSLGTVVSSLFAMMFPKCGFNVLRPTRIQPLYFPTWFVCAELEASVWLPSTSRSEGSRSEIATVQFDNLYLPGFSMDFGRVLVRNPPTQIKYAKPFSPDLAHQWGHDVMCLAYNVLPFDILDRVRTLSYADAVISENVRFSPQSVKMNLAAAYPVLLPVYLAQYTSREPWPPVTVIIAAHGDPDAHYLHIPHSDGEDSIRLPFEKFMGDQDDYVEVGEGTDVEAFVMTSMRRTRTSEKHLNDVLSSWLNDKLQQRNAPVSMVAEHPIDMEDLRIREWTLEEFGLVRLWLHMGRTQSYLKTFLKLLNFNDPRTLKSSREQPPKAVVDLKRTSQEWQQFRARRTPKWWIKWKQSQKPRQFDQ